MYIQQIEYKFADSTSLEEIADLAHNHLSALRMNGQICGKEWPLYQKNDAILCTVLTPEKHSLAPSLNNDYVTKAIADLENRACEISHKPVAEDMGGAPLCNCAKPTAYLLFTNYLSLEPPVRCLDCFGGVPLYRLPTMPDGEFYEIIGWQSDYQSCDSLQMGCATLEAEATRQLSNLNSSLTIRGLDLCNRLYKSTNTPFYYYLYRQNGRSIASEKKRRCPKCGEAWLNDKNLHSIFDFKCNNCHLLSNIAFSISA